MSCVVCNGKAMTLSSGGLPVYLLSKYSQTSSSVPLTMEDASKSVLSLSQGSNASVKQDMSLTLMASTALVKHIGLLFFLFPPHSNLPPLHMKISMSV